MCLSPVGDREVPAARWRANPGGARRKKKKPAGSARGLPAGWRLRSARRALGQDLEGRQGLALQHLEEGTAAGADVADLVRNAVLGNGGQGVAATRNGERAGGGNGAGQRLGAMRAKASNSNTPTGPFQTMVPAAFNCSASSAAVLGPMSRMRSSSATVIGGLHGGHGVGRKASWRRPHQQESAPLHRVPASPSMTARAWSSRSGSARLLPDLQAGGQHEGVGNAAADDQTIDLARQRLQDRQLGADLGARPRWPASGRFGVGQRLGDGVHLGRQQGAGASHSWRIARCRRYEASARCAVPKASCTKMSHSAAILLRQRLIVFLLARVQAAVLEQPATWPGCDLSTPSTQLLTPSGTFMTEQFSSCAPPPAPASPRA